MDKVYGAVTRITYYDEDKNFGIIKIKLDYRDQNLLKFKEVLFSNVLTVLSNFDRKPIIDEEFEFFGELSLTNYGWQFKAKSFSRRSEQNKEGVVTYLSSDYFPGIGKVTANKIFDELGPTALKDIYENIDVLNRIDITKKQKEIIYQGIKNNFQSEEELVKLLNLGLTMKMALKILKVIPENSYNLIKKNPYQLIDLVEGVAFLRADAIALQAGIKHDNPLRLKAAMEYVLKLYSFNNGHTYINVVDWYLETSKFININEQVLDEEKFDELVRDLIKERKIIQDQDKDIYLIKLYNDEIKLAAKIKVFLNSKQSDYSEALALQALDEVMQLQKIEYTKKQYEAIKKALLEPISIITGGPGTGKSTIIKGLIDTYAALFTNDQIIRESIKLVAPTGRAAKRLRELTHHPATTIHKLLGYEGGDNFFISPDNPIDAKMIIIDEFSMVDISLASLLFNCLEPHTKVVIIGDSDQLPSVGPGNVLYDLIQTKEITTSRLDQIHRQAASSTIISLAHNINEGRIPSDIISLQKDRNFIATDNNRLLDNIDQVISSALESGMDLISDIQVLVPIYKGDVGINAINSHLQKKFNPEGPSINIHGDIFRVNDKVIQLVNRHEKQVMNGDIGSVLTIDFENEKFKSLTVLFDFGPVEYDKDEIEDLSLAYAISIHKAQGSEFPLVIMPFSFKYYIMLKRKLIYTAITRAKKYLIMLGSLEALTKGVTQLEEIRKSKLGLRLKQALNSPSLEELKATDISEDSELKPEDFM